MQNSIFHNQGNVEGNLTTPYKDPIQTLKEVTEDDTHSHPQTDDSRKIIWKKFIKEQNQRKGFVTLKDFLTPQKINEFNLMSLRLS